MMILVVFAFAHASTDKQKQREGISFRLAGGNLEKNGTPNVAARPLNLVLTKLANFIGAGKSVKSKLYEKAANLYSPLRTQFSFGVAQTMKRLNHLLHS
jgi:hypothetical protein